MKNLILLFEIVITACISIALFNSTQENARLRAELNRQPVAEYEIIKCDTQQHSITGLNFYTIHRIGCLEFDSMVVPDSALLLPEYDYYVMFHKPSK